MKVPQFDLTRQFAELKAEIMPLVEEVLSSGRYILGPRVTQFEQEVAEYLGVKYAIGVGNGTDALILALKVLGVGPRDEVIVPTFTFFATAEVVSQLGATPVFVDIDPVSYNFDLNSVRQAVSPKTKAIIPVHLFGQPVDWAELSDLATELNLPLIEDACQAIGSSYRGTKVGALGDLACFSFFPTKNLGAAGDAGLITTNNTDYAEQLLRLRAHGSYKKYYHSEIGWNSRLDELQAAILSVKLRYLEGWIDKRRIAAHRYNELLQQLENVVTPVELPERLHVFHQYVVRFELRDELQKYLAEQGIGTSIYYPCPLHLQQVYEPLAYKVGSIPHAERAAQQTLALPLFPEITEQEQVYVVDKVRAFYRGAR